MQISLAGRGMADFDASAFATKDEREMLYAISKLDLSRNKLSLARGMQCLSNLTSLDISNNKLKSLAGLPLKLRRLDASNNDLKYIDGLTPLSQLEWLSVSGNELVSLSGLPGTTTLHHVDASHNRLPNVKGIELCVGVHELRLSHNLLRKVDDLISLRYLRSIRHLSIGDNPVTSNPRNATAIRLLVPKVTVLEGVGGAGPGGAEADGSSFPLVGAGGGGLPLAPPTGQAKVVVLAKGSPSSSRPGTPTNTSAQLSLSTIATQGNTTGGGGADSSLRQQLRAVEASVRPTTTSTAAASKEALYLSLLRTLDSSRRGGRSVDGSPRAASADGARRPPPPPSPTGNASALQQLAGGDTSSASRRPASPTSRSLPLDSTLNNGRAPLDASVPSLMAQRVMQSRIDELEKQLESTKMHLANASREAENYKIQVHQLKDTVERQAKINALLADRNAEMASAVASVYNQPMPAAPRVSFSTPVDGGSQQYTSHPSIAVSAPSAAAAHRNSMVADSGERRASSGGQHRQASVEPRNASPSDPSRRGSTRPSPPRNASPSAVTSSAAMAKPSTVVGGYARKQPTPTASPSATVSGGGRKTRRADVSPSRGSQVPSLRPQDLPALSMLNYTGGLAREATTPRQQQQQQQQHWQNGSKNVSFGGSQFYSPPQTYFS